MKERIITPDNGAGYESILSITPNYWGVVWGRTVV
jgi:hypothetical protein